MLPKWPDPIPVYADVQITRIVRKIIAWHALCRACGRQMVCKSQLKRCCDYRCRQALQRRLRRQREHQLEQEEELRLQRAEQALQLRRRMGRAGKHA